MVEYKWKTIYSEVKQEMPRPLKILKGFIEQDPSITRAKINQLLGETTTIAEETLKQFSTCLSLLLNKSQASEADPCIFDLVVRFCNDIRAANILIQEGFILQALMMQRDAIEIRVVAEYLHTHPQDAEAWRIAETYRERRRFSINELKNKVKDGKEWKDIWDSWSSYIHPNSGATTTYGKSRPFFGYNLYLGGFYDPVPIASLFGIQLAICINFLESFMDWYKDDLQFPSELHRKVEMLDEMYHNQIDRLKERASSEQQEIDDKIKQTRLSKEEIVKMFRFLDTLP